MSDNESDQFDVININRTDHSSENERDHIIIVNETIADDISSLKSEIKNLREELQILFSHHKNTKEEMIRENISLRNEISAIKEIMITTKTQVHELSSQMSFIKDTFAVEISNDLKSIKSIVSSFDKKETRERSNSNSLEREKNFLVRTHTPFKFIPDSYKSAISLIS